MHPCGRIMKYRSRNQGLDIIGIVSEFLNFLKGLGKERQRANLKRVLSGVQLFFSYK